MMDLLKKLTQTTAPSGSENNLYDIIKPEISDYVDEIYIDPLGSLVAHKKGNGKRVMFAAHMDEIGLIVTYILDNGYIKVSNIGGVNPHNSLSARIKFQNGIIGVVSYENNDADSIKNLKLSDLYVDIGTKSREETQKLVSVGDTACFVGDYVEQNNIVISKAMDDRVGCYALIQAIKSFRNSENDLYFCFTFGEELGLRGAKALAESVKPDFGIAVDVTRTGDCIGSLKMAVSVGEGVAVKIKDNSILCHPYIKNLMVELCKTHDIKYQLEVLETGGTDSGAIHLSNGGVPSGCVSIPTRYIHSPSELCSIDDVNSAVNLLTKLIERSF